MSLAPFFLRGISGDSTALSKSDSLPRIFQKIHKNLVRSNDLLVASSEFLKMIHRLSLEMVGRFCLALGGTAPTLAVAQVRITEVTISTGNVELTNFGPATVDLSGWRFCHRFSYTSPGGTIAAGVSRQFTVAFNKTSSDLGLYNSTTFSSTSAMQDFLEWGGGGLGRESVAASKGIWTAGAFLAVPANGVSLHAKANPGAGTRMSNWFTAFPHAGFPLPNIEVKSVSLVSGEWRLTALSYYLLANHRVETSSDLGVTPWVTATPTVSDLGNKLLDLRFPATGARQFLRVKAL